jgi:hypothetical protein
MAGTTFQSVPSCVKLSTARSPAADFEIEMGACNIRYGKHTVQTLQMYEQIATP